MSGITVGQAGDVLVAVKQASDPEHRARLRHEADLLGRVDHPGVVRLVDFTEGPPTALRTAFVGPDSWRTTTASPAAFASLTATVADLHDSGLTHGDLRTDHVLVDAQQRPILCGFAEAGPATTERMQADRVALAAMLREQAGDHDAAAAGRLRDAARALDEPALPTRAAIRLLDELPASTPTARPRTWPSPRWFAGGGAAIAAIGVVVVVWSAIGPDSTATGPPHTNEAGPPPTTHPEPPPQPEPTPAVTEPAIVVEHEGRSYGVGAPGDLVEVADWTCSGTATPAVLRPSSGMVAVFSTWPEPGGSLRPDLETVVDGAVDFAIDDDPCPELRVRTPEGSRLIEVSP